MSKIRKAKEKDLVEISSLEAQLFKEKSWSYTTLEKELKNSFSQFWILEKESDIVGYLIFRPILEEVELLRLGIKTKYQNQKLGTLFLNFF